MSKHLVLAVALGTGMSAAAFAQEAPKTSDDCFKSVIDLQKTAADKKLSDDKNAKIEDLLTKMEGHCEAQKFTDAASTATEIKAAIEGK
jgi:hypothetical protein